MKISVQSLFEDYEDDTVELRRAAVAQVQLLRPDGTPLANTGVTLRGGVYRNRLAAEVEVHERHPRHVQYVRL